jgi:hypothetical protein
LLAIHPPISERLIDALIAQPAACVREQAIIKSIQWRCVDSAKVERLLAALLEESIRLPTWLARSLVISGHFLPARYQVDLEAPLSSDLPGWGGEISRLAWLSLIGFECRSL